MNIYEIALREKFRYSSVKGELNTEQLWDLPLSSRTGFDLDSVAKAVNKQLKEVSEESFVSTKENALQKRLEIQLDVVKAIISYKLEQQEAEKTRAARLEERNRLLEILDQKQDQALLSLSPEEIKKRIAELS